MKVIMIIMLVSLIISLGLVLCIELVRRSAVKISRKSEEAVAMQNRAQAEAELEKEKYTNRSKDADLKYEATVRDRAMQKARLAETVLKMNDDQRRDFIFMLQIKSGQFSEQIKNLSEELVYEKMRNNALAMSVTSHRSIYGGW